MCCCVSIPRAPVPSAKRALALGVKTAAATVDSVRVPAQGVVVLLYHRVGRRSSLEVDLEEAVFEDQMAFLADSTDVIPLDLALERLSAPGYVPRAPSVAVTFDDGTDDFVDVALPVLARYRIPVTMYLATSFVEDGVAFPGGGLPASWSGLADACATGLVDVGSHTHRHRLLDRLAPGEVAEELDRSVGLIAERLGRAVTDFAYPKAVLGSPDAERAVQDRFRSAALAGTRPNAFGHTDVYRLARSPIQRLDATRFFRRKVAGGMALEDAMRRMANRIRYAGARS